MKSPSSLYGTGIFLWLVILAVFFFIALGINTESSPEVALIWALQHWYAGFLLGGVGILALGFKNPRALAQALGAYSLPVVLLGALVVLILVIYPDPSLRDSLLGYLPVVIVFYAAGWFWSQLRKKSGGTWLRMTLPPILGGLMLMLLVAVPAFASNAFIYRDAFQLQIRDIAKGNNQLAVECSLEINKPGDYSFSAPPAHLFDIVGYHGEGDIGQEAPTGTIIWATGTPPEPGSTGKFELIMEWPIDMESIANIDEAMEFFPLYLEVREGKDGEVLTTVPALADR